MSEIERLNAIASDIAARTALGRELWNVPSTKYDEASVSYAAAKIAPYTEAIVRAILTAMREPSEGMLKAEGLWAFDDQPAEIAWQAMIDHILNEESK